MGKERIISISLCEITLDFSIGWTNYFEYMTADMTNMVAFRNPS